jgi:hypothetical protein
VHAWACVAALALWAAACDGPAPDVPRPAAASPAAASAVAARPVAAPPAWDGRTFRSYRDGPSGVGLEIPVLGYRLEARHFAGARPPQAAHILTLSGGAGVAAVVDVWDDPAPGDVARWFDAHLGFMREPTAALVETTAGRDRARALLIEQPRSPQAAARRSAVFAAAGRVLRVTCPDAEDAQLAGGCARVLATITAEAPR